MKNDCYCDKGNAKFVHKNHFAYFCTPIANYLADGLWIRGIGTVLAPYPSPMSHTKY